MRKIRPRIQGNPDATLKGLMKMKESELLDRWSILIMKARLDKGARKELRAFRDDVKRVLRTDLRLIVALMRLMEQNAKIWGLEHAMRLGIGADPETEKRLSFREIGKRAVAIREHNRLRIVAKKEIDRLFGSISDNKVQHLSR